MLVRRAASQTSTWPSTNSPPAALLLGFRSPAALRIHLSLHPSFPSVGLASGEDCCPTVSALNARCRVESRRRCVYIEFANSSRRILSKNRKIENWTWIYFIQSSWLQNWKLGHDFRPTQLNLTQHPSAVVVS